MNWWTDHNRLRWWMALWALAVAGCDPVINLAGANFPAWLLCLLTGASAAALVRVLFAKAGLEPYLWSTAIVYGCLTLMVAMAMWLVFFNRT